MAQDNSHFGGGKVNKDNAKDYLPLVQALAEGKVIQFHNGVGDWQDINGGVDFLMPAMNYRIKPEPRDIWVNEYFDGEFNVHTSKESAESSIKRSGITRQYREVIE